MDAGAKACYNMQKQLKAIDKELGKTRLDFINVRNIRFWKSKRKEIRLGKKDFFIFLTRSSPSGFLIFPKILQRLTINGIGVYRESKGS